MKNLMKIFTSICVMALMFVSCEKESNVTEVSVRIQPSLIAKSGVMTKASNHDVFSEFYTAISDGTLVAEEYDLTFTEVTNGITYHFTGHWNLYDMVTIKAGVYRVVGTSKAKGEFMQDRASLVINDLVEVSAYSDKVVVSADYDCYLLVFSADNLTAVRNYNGVDFTPLYKFKDYFYTFVNDKLFVDNAEEAFIDGCSENGASFKIRTDNFPFVNGMYYVYSGVMGTFVVPEMQDGWGEYVETESNPEVEGFGRIASVVDLGLSVLWSTWNLGAENEFDYGGLYGLGDPTGYLTSICASDYYYVGVGGSICGTEYDLATVKWGDDWRLPTSEELEELVTNCSWESETNNNINGVRVTGPNCNSIFIPYAGDRTGNTVANRGTEAHLWAGDEYSVVHGPGYYDIDIKNGAVVNQLPILPCYGGRDGSSMVIGQTIRPVKNFVTFK